MNHRVKHMRILRLCLNIYLSAKSKARNYFIDKQEV